MDAVERKHGPEADEDDGEDGREGDQRVDVPRRPLALLGEEAEDVEEEEADGEEEEEADSEIQDDEVDDGDVTPIVPVLAKPAASAQSLKQRGVRVDTLSQSAGARRGGKSASKGEEKLDPCKPAQLLRLKHSLKSDIQKNGFLCGLFGVLKTIL